MLKNVFVEKFRHEIFIARPHNPHANSAVLFCYLCPSVRLSVCPFHVVVLFLNGNTS